MAHTDSEKSVRGTDLVVLSAAKDLAIEKEVSLVRRPDPSLRSAIVDLPTLALAVVAAFLLVRYRASSLWLILAGAALGFVM
jgi:hypothetical protein